MSRDDLLCHCDELICRCDKLLCHGNDLLKRGNDLLCLRLCFLEVHILTTTYQKAFILGPYVPYQVGFPFMPSDYRVQARGIGLQGSNQEHDQDVEFLG